MSSEEQDRLLVIGALESSHDALCRRRLIDATRLTDLRLDVALSSLCRSGRVQRTGRSYILARVVP